MGKLKNIPYKSLQYLNDQPETTTAGIDSKNSKDVHQVFLQQSVTLLAFKDKAINNGTIAPDVLHPKLFFGVVPEDIPLFIGAVIGASLIIALFLVFLTFWKCCYRMTVLSKKKEYWLDPKDASIKNKRKIPVVQRRLSTSKALMHTQKIRILIHMSVRNFLSYIACLHGVIGNMSS
ncbi:uncharacterized protein LOC118200250 [Stegodyphus dumicola]|uniref:uncharacterized protein LOC118200250 n=1 Tax=Stegodyphus dumicola TaxID=202533 RepID=UPI0015AFCE34|nr:uncharacterized protein LOC118200250 [Stegodyphus dumicola]